MELYLIRHGIAADPQDYNTDEARPLTKEGERKTEKIAKRLKELEIQFDLILSSSLVRALQTAKILLEVGLSHTLEEDAALAPDGNLDTWLNGLEQWQKKEVKRLALIGHQPNLANWAETLVWGEAKGVIVLKKAGIIGLNLPDTIAPKGQSQLFWLTPPKFLLG